MKYLKYFIPALVIMIIVVFGIVNLVKANPSYFASSASTSTATSTGKFMTAGTATSTETFDAQTGTLQAMDSATLFIQFTGSSTASNINITIQHSQDGIDWYNEVATTTQFTRDITPITPLSMTFASTSFIQGGYQGGYQNGVATSTTNKTVFQSIPILTPTRYTRSIITMPIGSLNGTVWQQFIGKRQTAF